MANKDDYLTSYREFFEYFAQTVNPNDQLPVKLASYKLLNLEVVGGIIDWTTQYLTQKKCPPHLFSPLIKIIIEEIRKACKKHPHSCGFNSDDNAYEPLKLMQAVMAKTNEVCLRYLDNSMLCSLPAPSNLYYETSIYAMRNKRRTMEDRHVAIHDLNTMFNVQEASPSSYYAIFDGHAGHHAAAYSYAHLHQFLAENKYFVSNPEQALLDAFCKTDALFLEKCKVENLSGGTTAVVALLRPKEKTLYIAWVGDSQALLVKQGKILQCVNPHKPCREDERERIEKAGGCVMLWGTWRVNGQLAVSRAIGDLDYKPHVIAIPDVREVSLDGHEDFLIIACDGLWDFLTEDAAAQEVYYKIVENPDETERISKHLVQLARDQGSGDNISVIVVFLREPHKIAAEAQHWATRNGPPLTTDNMEAGLDNANNPFTNSNGSLKSLDVETDNIHLQKGANDGLLLNLTDNFKANGTEFTQEIFEKSNGTKKSSSEIHFDDDLGPETDVDVVDDAFSPVEKTKTFAECLRKGFNDENLPKSFNEEVKAFTEGLANNNPLDEDFNPFLSKQISEDSNKEDKSVDDFEEHGGDNREETTTPPVDTVHDVGGLEENPAESDSEDEWNYFQGDQAKPETLSSQPETVVETSETEDAMSQLNPNAAEFVPVSPTRSIPSPACRALINDEVISQSPKRPVPVDIKVPNETEFETEVKSRPSDFDAYSNGHDSDSEHNTSGAEQMESILNGKNIDDIPEFHPGSTPAKQPAADEFHFGPNAAPFTPRPLDQSEALSTKANYGDDTEQTLNTSFNDSEFALPPKDLGDPMSMSFSAERGESNPFQDDDDLNKVHDLPENLDEFLGKNSGDGDKENRILDDTISDLPEHDVLGQVKDNDQAVIQTTDLDKLSQDDEKELASPLEPDQDDLLDIERNVDTASKTPDSNLLEGFVVVPEKLMTDDSNISSLPELEPIPPREVESVSPVPEPQPELTGESRLSPLPVQLEQQEEIPPVLLRPNSSTDLEESKSPLPEDAVTEDSTLSPLPGQLDSQPEEVLSLSPQPELHPDLIESKSPLLHEADLPQSKSPIPNETDLPQSKSPLPEIGEQLQSISPIPNEAELLHSKSPIPNEADLPRSISPLPEIEEQLQLRSPIPSEPELFESKSPVPNEAVFNQSKSPLPELEEQLQSRSPIPSEHELLQSKSPIPNEADLPHSKSPLPEIEEQLQSRSPIPNEAELVPSKSPIPNETELPQSNSPIPEAVEVLQSKSPLPNEAELLQSKSPVPDEIELPQSNSPIPQAAELLRPESPLPNEAELFDSKSPLPNEAELLQSKSPVPSEDKLPESNSPVPAAAELLQSKSPLLNETEQLQSRSPVPNETELLQSKSPILIEQEQETVQIPELSEQRLSPLPGQLDLRSEEVRSTSPQPPQSPALSKSPLPEEGDQFQSESLIPTDQEPDNLQEPELIEGKLSPLSGWQEPEKVQEPLESNLLDVVDRQIQEDVALGDLESQGLACEFTLGTKSPLANLEVFEVSKSPVCELDPASDILETEFNPKSEVENINLETKSLDLLLETAASPACEFSAEPAVCALQPREIEIPESHSPIDLQEQKQEEEITSSVKDDISSPIEPFSPVKSPEPAVEESQPDIIKDHFSTEQVQEASIQEQKVTEIPPQEILSQDLLGDLSCPLPSSQPLIQDYAPSAPLEPSRPTEFSNGFDNLASEVNEQFSIKTDSIKPEFAEPAVITPSEDSKIIDEAPIAPLSEVPVQEPKAQVELAESVQEAPKELPNLAPLPIVSVTTPQEAKEVKKEEKKTPSTKKPIGKVAPAKSSTAPKTGAVKASPKPTAGSPKTGVSPKVPPKAGTAKPTAATKTTTTTSTTAAAKPLPRPKTALAPKSAEKKPLTNGDLKPSPKTTLTKRPSTEAAATKTTARPATSAAPKTTSLTKTTAPRPATAPKAAPLKTSATAPKPAASSTTAAAKPRVPLSHRGTATTATATSKSATSTTTKTTTTTTITSRTSLSPKTATAPPKSRTITNAAPKPRAPLTKTVTKSAADVEKEKKESANKLTASRTTTVTKTTSGTATNRTATTTVKKTETKPLSRTVASKTSTTTTTTKTTLGKKPGEVKSVTKTKTTKIEKPKENGVPPTNITEEIKEITVIKNIVNENETLLKDNSPLDNKLITESNALIDVNPAD